MDVYNYFSFWAIFCPFTHLPAQKIKILKIYKKHLEISSFDTSVPKIMIMCCTVPEIWCVTDVIVISNFGLFFALLPPNNPKNQTFKKIRKTPGEYPITYVRQKLWSDDIRFLRYGGRWTDGKMDGRKKWHIEVRAPPNKNTTAK